MTGGMNRSGAIRINRRALLSASLVLPVAGGLAGCFDEPRPRAEPTFYADQSRPGATIDLRTATEIINAYRANTKLSPLQPDPALNAIAKREAERLAARGELEDGENASLASSLASAGIPPRQVRKSLSAGYQNFADAFSGWRGAPHHDRVLKAERGKRYGVAAHHRAGSRHRIYWVLLVAE